MADRKTYEEWTGHTLLDEQLRLRALEMATYRCDPNEDTDRTIYRAVSYYVFLSGAYKQRAAVR